MPELTEADHCVTFHVPGREPRIIRAAYVTTEDKHPDMLAFHDHEHRTVALVNREAVLHVERLEQQGADAAKGFQPTSQVMEQM